MPKTILTDAMVRRLRPPVTGRVETWDASLPGFGVRITDTGRRSWVLMTRLHGRPIRLTWPYPATSLANARKRAKDAIHAVACGEDPRVVKRRPARGPLAFEAVAAEFIEQYAKPKNRSWAEQERHLLKYVIPRWKLQRLDLIGREDVAALAAEIMDEHGPTQANRVQATVKTLFSWALDQGKITVHPAARLKGPGPITTRDRVLTDEELRKAWRAWDGMGYPWGAAFKLLALTGTRRGEVEGMTWDEIDRAQRCWSLPAARTKVKLPVLVPLTAPALAVLADVPRFDDCPFVFSNRGTTPIRDWSGAVETVTKAAGFNGWRTHDLRRTVRTGLSRLGVSSDIAERVLGHKIGGVRGVYDRHDYLAEKRDALERWSAHVMALVAGNG